MKQMSSPSSKTMILIYGLHLLTYAFFLQVCTQRLNYLQPPCRLFQPCEEQSLVFSFTPFLFLLLLLMLAAAALYLYYFIRYMRVQDTTLLQQILTTFLMQNVTNILSSLIISSFSIHLLLLILLSSTILCGITSFIFVCLNVHDHMINSISLA